MTERRYDEEEVAIILQKAAESRVGPAEGLTLAQLKEIAADVGIEPTAVETAARALDRRLLTTSASPILGTPAAPQLEQTVDVPFDRIDQAELVLAIRRAMERHGVLQTTAQGLEWRARDATGGRYVSVLARGPRTMVRVLGNFRDGAVAWLAVGGMMSFVSLLIFLKSIGMMVPGPAKGLSVLLSAVAGFLGGRALWSWRYRREQRQLAAALDAAVEAIASGAKAAPAPASAGQLPEEERRHVQGEGD